MSVVDLAAERDRREAEAWDRFVAAKTRADRTLRIEDGREAAKAWSAFLELFQTPAQTAWIKGAAARFEKRT
ncbi:hypothetical protein MMB17_18435 [Methylobacterium organophilum]|uniref:hypothetical protein n=1 Tax=Methylobacterium organophilum TaxID=410 RepID=UPI001F13CDC7|nr:hypothetical protein [Methylobacterium organophilum]UMY16642.1 hypothetical protein MMB17_18435 [Methylobacterium organophilum]